MWNHDESYQITLIFSWRVPRLTTLSKRGCEWLIDGLSCAVLQNSSLAEQMSPGISEVCNALLRNPPTVWRGDDDRWHLDRDSWFRDVTYLRHVETPLPVCNPLLFLSVLVLHVVPGMFWHVAWHRSIIQPKAVYAKHKHLKIMWGVWLVISWPFAVAVAWMKKINLFRSVESPKCDDSNLAF